MKVYVYEKRVDGTLDITKPIVADSDNVPEGLFLADSEKTYNELGYEIEPPKQSLPEPTETERIEALEQALLEIVLGGVF